MPKPEAALHRAASRDDVAVLDALVIDEKPLAVVRRVEGFYEGAKGLQGRRSPVWWGFNRINTVPPWERLTPLDVARRTVDLELSFGSVLGIILEFFFLTNLAA